MSATPPQPTTPRSRMIAVALNEPTTDHARAALRRAAERADIVELRIDLMDECNLPRLLHERPCPVVVTCRAVREGGRWSGTEDDRLDVLRQAIDLGAEYVDVEADAFHRITDRGRSLLIASSHDFATMPNDLPGLWRRLAETGADVVKVVGMARDARDVVAVERMLSDADRPTIAIAMGPAGLATRVLALRHEACLLTFCALESGGGTAPGQIGVDELLSVYDARRLSRQTAVVGLLTPAVDADAVREWNARLRRSGENRIAVPLEDPADVSAPDVVTALRDLDLAALYVDEAFQEVVGQAVDELDVAACRCGRVNLIEWRDDRLVGGWVADPDEAVTHLDRTAVRA